MRGLTFSLLHRREPVRFIHKSSFPFSQNKRQINTIFSYSFSAEVFLAITCTKSRSLLCFFFLCLSESCMYSENVFSLLLFFLPSTFPSFFFRKPDVIRQVFKGLFFFFLDWSSQRVCDGPSGVSPKCSSLPKYCSGVCNRVCRQRINGRKRGRISFLSSPAIPRHSDRVTRRREMETIQAVDWSLASYRAQRSHVHLGQAR